MATNSIVEPSALAFIAVNTGLTSLVDAAKAVCETIFFKSSHVKLTFSPVISKSKSGYSYALTAFNLNSDLLSEILAITSSTISIVTKSDSSLLTISNKNLADINVEPTS